MTDYFFSKGWLILGENFVKGIVFSLPLIFDGTIQKLMYLSLVVFILKGVYDFYKENKSTAPLLILLCVPLSGVFTGFSTGIIGIALYYHLLFILSPSIMYFTLASLIVLPGGIYLACRLGAYKYRDN
jgi:hypothetical protein